MAGNYEEDFVYQEIYNLEGKNLRVFEFGCGQNLFINKIVQLGHNLTAIDLYERTSDIQENRKFNFIKNDFNSEYFEPNSYDCIYALSSVEHIGLEDTILEWNEAQTKIEKTFKKFCCMLKRRGTLLLTLPFGNYKQWYVNDNGISTRHMHKDGKNKSRWGAKVYDINDIIDIEKFGFSLERKEFYLKPNISTDYFDKNSWIITDYMQCYKTREPAGAVACLKYIKTQ